MCRATQRVKNSLETLAQQPSAVINHLIFRQCPNSSGFSDHDHSQGVNSPCPGDLQRMLEPPSASTASLYSPDISTPDPTSRMRSLRLYSCDRSRLLATFVSTECTPVTSISVTSPFFRTTFVSRWCCIPLSLTSISSPPCRKFSDIGRSDGA